MSRLPTVGLTGGLASGKSTVAAGLADRGAAVLDADRVVHQLYLPGRPGAEMVERTFGVGVMAGDGSVDREALGRRVLGDTGALQLLNRVIHPLVRQEVEAWLGELADQPAVPPVAVVEAALLVETGSYRSYDLLVVAWCRPEQQLARAVARGVPEERTRQLLAAQMPLADKRRLADVVIDCSGRLADLDGELDRAWDEITARCGANRTG